MIKNEVLKYIRTNSYKAWVKDNTVNVDRLLTNLGIGTIIKRTSKTVSVRYDKYFIKYTTYPFVEGMLRHLILSNRCRNGWIVGNHLFEHHIPTPQPIAYIEKLFNHIPYQHILCTEYLSEHIDVEKFIQTNRYKQFDIEIDIFFENLYNLIVQLWDLGIYHKDLSGKNLLTYDGRKIYLTDLDAVRINKHISVKEKIRNLVQVYDSFCDFVSEPILEHLICRLISLISTKNMDINFDMIKKLQQTRRTKHLKSIQRMNNRY